MPTNTHLRTHTHTHPRAYVVQRTLWYIENCTRHKAHPNYIQDATRRNLYVPYAWASGAVKNQMKMHLPATQKTHAHTHTHLSVKCNV